MAQVKILKTNVIFWQLRFKNSKILKKIMIIKKPKLDVMNT
jgi:hypothetical protein